MKTIYRLKLIFLLFFCLAVELKAQNKKVEFRKISWEEAMAAAHREDKYIFVDVYMKGRANDPREEVENNVFAIDSIADYFNESFVSIRVDMLSEAGQDFAPKLQMLMYPAYVYFSAEGDQLNNTNAHTALTDVDKFIESAWLAIKRGEVKKANSRSIAFESEALSWQDILAKAKKENKPIFVDTYTTWCRPCIRMAKDIFTLDNVADFYNKHFINVKINADKGDGPGIIKRYGVKGYPAFLYIDHHGQLLLKEEGFTKAGPFIELGKNVLKN